MKRENDLTPLKSFDYVLFPGMKLSLPVEWTYLTTEKVESENIRCHKLQAGDHLTDLLEEFGQSYAKAVVLINTEDSYQLAEEFISSVKESNFPIVIIKKSDGDDILYYINGFEQLFAQVNKESSRKSITSSEPYKRKDSYKFVLINTQ